MPLTSIFSATQCDQIDIAETIGNLELGDDPQFLDFEDRIEKLDAEMGALKAELESVSQMMASMWNFASLLLQHISIH